MTKDKKGNKEEIKEKKVKLRRFDLVSEAIMGTLVILFYSALFYLGWFIILAIIQFLFSFVPGASGIEWIFYGLKLIGIPISIVWALVRAFKKLAPKDKFFTFTKEGTVRFVMLGEGFYKLIMQWEGHAFDKDWNVVETKKKRRHLFGGFRYIGLPPFKKILEYIFKWTGVNKDNVVEQKEDKIKHMLLMPDAFLTRIEKAEDRNGLPLDVSILITAKVTNPYKAKFKIQNWMETFVNKTKPDVVALMHTDVYDNWKKRKEDIGKIILAATKKSGHWDEFRDEYGIEMTDIGLWDIQPPASYVNLTLLEYEADQRKKAAIKLAEGKKKTDIIIAQGQKQAAILEAQAIRKKTEIEARGIRQKTEIEAQGARRKAEIEARGEKKRIALEYGEIQKFGDLGKLIKVFEQARHSQFAASLVVQRYPGIESLLSDLFGKKPEEITSDEIKKMAEQLKEIQKKLEKNQKGKP